ncbi:MAG: glycosyltransferase family 1 protein [Gemmatimonadaceae bacterium]
MRVGIDGSCLANGRGYGRFTRELLRAVAARSPEHEFVLFCDARAAATWPSEFANVSVVVVAQRESPTLAAAAGGSRGVLDMLRFTRAVARQQLDVFFSPSVYTYFPLPPRLRALMTVHDAIADRFPDLTFPDFRARLFWRVKMWLALKQARLVLTVSDYAARDIAAVYGFPSQRIRVATEAPAPIYAPSETCEDIKHVATQFGIASGARWFIYVGGFNPHKHVDVIVRAHAAACSSISDPPHLVLVGTRDDDVFHSAGERIDAETRHSPLADRIHWTGFVPDGDLRHLLSGAIALLLPSECEGFGLPAVEAAACGTPVIATTASPLPELLAGGGIFIAPGSERELTAAMRVMLEDESTRRAMGVRARECARALSWDRAADVTLDALREAAA